MPRFSNAPIDQISPGIGMGKIPYWLRQKGLVSRTLDTMRPGGYLLTRRAVDVCGFGPADFVLDAGCGGGMTLAYLQETHQIRTAGLDMDPALLARAGKRIGPGPPLVQGALPDLPFHPGTFRGIFCECVLSLVEDPVLCLKAFKRTLATNGYLVVSDLYLRQWLPDYIRPGHPGTCAQGAVPLMQMMSWMETAGLNIHIIEDHSGLLCQLGTMLPDHRPLSDGEQAGRPKVPMGYTMIIAQKV